VVLTIRPIAGQESIRSIAALGAVAALSLAAMLGGARRLAPYLPQVLAAPMSALPPVTSPARLLQCLAASVSTHLLTALSGHALVQGLVPDASVADALVFVPLSMATIYLPITVGGAGVREAAFASLYGTVGIDESTAVAASIGMFGIQLAVSGVGGLLHLWWPLGITPSPDSQETD
jgi:uncharacterized membrane protein YbhN (UPF0104 family)